MIVIANKDSFYPITDIIPKLLERWEADEGFRRTDDEAIEVLMKEFNCTVMVRGDSFEDMVPEILRARGIIE